MRKALAGKEDLRGSFTGTFKRYGKKDNYRGSSSETVLLVSIKDITGKEIADHLWFNLTKGFEKLGMLRDGDIIQFQARVKKYTKGYVNQLAKIDERKQDYKLSHPTQFEIVRSR